MTIHANQQTPQQPLHTEYRPCTTAEEIIQGVDLAGKVAIAIGGYFRYWLGGIEAISQGRRPSIVPARSRDKAIVALDSVQ
ncbi:hypothetical protein QFZ77_001358 [Paenibacillus sp. V4I3]|uniref:hypothetical protein n=1 Tax=unclassified Paenibacillus TaxID=185978 RepID=UPI00278B87CB|nr:MULTISPECIES: hypothetical protein [unclassified Paenibacillus]MDQ0872699.1 hypothetical protein [Paenibacillus sp. V4I3]MDQ0891418.1 hypothetical protein [Paenibacillus sp. V4I9]